MKPKDLDVRPYDRTTDRPTVQGATCSMRGQLYHGHYLIISPLHGHGEVANENSLILLRTLSIVSLSVAAKTPFFFVFVFVWLLLFFLCSSRVICWLVPEG